MAVSSGSPVFEWVCAALASKGVMSELEARGTVRLLVKEAGLSASTVQRAPMMIVLPRLLQKHLQQRKVRDAARIVEEIVAELGRVKLEEARGADSPEEIFARLGLNKP